MAPAHITGFFYPHITENPLTSGSMGAGFSLKIYSKTIVEENREGIRVYINDEDKTQVACTSKRAAELFLNKIESKGGFTIKHYFNYPIGCGLASSGAGSLGVVFALNDLLDAGLARIELARIAHTAEVQCRTGLGSVVGQYDGMFEIRIKPGAPGHGEVVRYKVEEPVGLIVFRGVETKSVLSSKNALERVKEAFGDKNVELRRDFSIENFLEKSREFAYRSGLVTDVVDRTLKAADELKIEGSMLMLGEGVFLMGENVLEKFPLLLNRVKKIAKPIYNKITYIDNLGVRESWG